MKDYEKPMVRELHLIASTLIELVGSTGHADFDNFDLLESEYDELDEYIEDKCKLEGD